MDKLDEHIIKCKSIENIFGGESTIASWLIELKQRREADLRPADKFLSATVNKQYEHIVSEIGEASVELVKVVDFDLIDEIPRAVEELIDVQMSCETMIAILGLNEQQRREARCKVIEKNEARGYYRKGEE